MRKHPHLIELNAAIFLTRMSEKYGRRCALDSIPQNEWDLLSGQGFDFVWMMGVWKRSPGARRAALSSPDLLRECRAVLPDFKESDLMASPYSVYGYEADSYFGNAECLVKLRENLKRSGLGLILDYVPNHLALDHPWIVSHPEYFIEVPRDIALQKQEIFFKTSGDRFFAHGRDPHFPPWTDTIQINFFSEKARVAAVESILKIAEIADGIRCDMAMLGLTRIFESTWGEFLGGAKAPQKEFWGDVIKKVKVHFPKFVFIAEVYWDLEWEMQQQGFDFTYDKKLYDRLRFSEALRIEEHLKAEQGYQEHSVRFIENHDEHRAVAALGYEKSKVSAVIMSTVPGMRLFHDGQIKGKKIRVPVQLMREPHEIDNPDTCDFYQKLLKYSHDPVFHEGAWELCLLGNSSQSNKLLAWTWRLGKEWRLVVVNDSPQRVQDCIFFQSEPLSVGVVRLKDVLTGVLYERDAEELKKQGLYVDLEPWKFHLFEIKAE